MHTKANFFLWCKPLFYVDLSQCTIENSQNPFVCDVAFPFGSGLVNHGVCLHLAKAKSTSTVIVSLSRSYSIRMNGHSTFVESSSNYSKFTQIYTFVYYSHRGNIVWILFPQERRGCQLMNLRHFCFLNRFPWSIQIHYWKYLLVFGPSIV